MSEPSQSREQLRRAIKKISSRPPPYSHAITTNSTDSYPSLPKLETTKLKDCYGWIIFIALAIITFLAVIFITIQWRFD